MIVVDGCIYQELQNCTYSEALVDAAQVDWMLNSTELNNGIQRSHVVELLSDDQSSHS